MFALNIKKYWRLHILFTGVMSGIVFTYYLPNLLYIKLPSILYSLTYLFMRYPKIALYKRPLEWTNYIHKHKSI